MADDYSLTRRRPEQDPPYDPKSGGSSRRRPSNLRQQPPIQGNYQYCTAACLNALKRDAVHPNCPNIREHRAASPATIDTVIKDVTEALQDMMYNWSAGEIVPSVSQSKRLRDIPLLRNRIPIKLSRNYTTTKLLSTIIYQNYKAFTSQSYLAISKLSLQAVKNGPSLCRMEERMLRVVL